MIICCIHYCRWSSMSSISRWDNSPTTSRFPYTIWNIQHSCYWFYPSNGWYVYVLLVCSLLTRNIKRSMRECIMIVSLAVTGGKSGLGNNQELLIAWLTQELQAKIPRLKWPKTQLIFRPPGLGHPDISNCALF